MIEPVKKENVVDIMVDQIKKLIIEGDLVPGDKLLPERELMDQFEVGRTSLREALKVLESQGLIERSQKGTFISMNYNEFFSESLTYQLYLVDSKIEDIFESRILIEKELAYLAAVRWEEEEIELLKESLLKMERSIQDHNQNLFVEADILFHSTIAKASKNIVLFDLFTSIQNLVSIVVTEAGVNEKALAYHREIYTAIHNREALKAKELMFNHIDSVAKRLMT